MTKKSKKIIRILLPFLTLALFALISIVVITLSQGKKITTNGVVETSIISLNPLPSGTLAYINDKPVAIIDNKITDIAPGAAKLTITRAGYSKWEKSIELDSGIVKEVYVQLYPDTLNFVNLVTSNIDKIFYSNDSNYVFFTILDESNPGESGLWKLKLTKSLLDFGDNKPFQIAKFDDSLIKLLNKVPYTLVISNDDNKVILFQKSNLVLNLYDANQFSKGQDLSMLIGSFPDEISWFNGSDSIVFKKSNLLFEYSTSTQQTNLITLNELNEIPYTVTFNTVYYLKNMKIYKYFSKTSSELVLPETVDFSNEKILSLNSTFTNSQVLVVTTDKRIYYFDFDKNFTATIENATTLDISNDSRKIIFVKNGSIYSYILEDSIDGRSLVANVNNLSMKQNDFQKVAFTSSSQNIQSVSVTNVVKISDIDGQNSTVIMKDFKLISSNILLSKDNTEVYGLLEYTNENKDKVNNLFKFNLQLE